MQLTVHTMMFGWPIVSLLLFLRYGPRKAVTISLLAGWLLLPQAKFSLPGIPDYSRYTAVALSIILCVFIFDSGRLINFRLKRIDLPMVVWCLCPMTSSLANGLGAYDGLSGVISFTISFGIPYLIGRLYFADSDGMRSLAIGLILAVLCYTPLILFELRMSPQLHKHIYGYLQVPFHTVWRLGWYRPMVFLHNGLEMGVLVASATLTAIWLWRTRAVKKISLFSARFAALTLLVICILCRALNGYIILIMGLGTLYLIKTFRVRTLVFLLVLIPPVYIFGRVVTNWDAVPLVEAIESIDEKRARSLQSRISHEITLIDKAMQRPYFGWGGYGRNRADNLARGAMGHKSVTDSFWIIALGQRGLTGLIGVGLVLLLPIASLARRLPAAEWSDPVNAPAAVLSMVLLGFTVDCLANAMISPIYIAIAGGLIGYRPVFKAVKSNKALS
jgi:hypothetical protein